MSVLVIGSSSCVAKFDPSAAQRGLVVSIFTAGAFVGAGIGGPSGDAVGRRFTIIVGAIIFCIGGALQTGAETISYLYGGRFLAGTG
jgi:MFS family permease